MVTPALPRYNNRSRSQQHSANNAQHHIPRIFRPIIFTNTQVYHASPQKDINHIPIANDASNQDTGASLEYRQLIQDETTFPVWNKEAANECGRLAQGVGGGGGGKRSNTMFVIPRQAIPKGKIVTYGCFAV
jgi:hypothetical protein